MSRFTEILKNVGETIQQVAPGLSWSKVVSDVKAEANRLGVQGQMEAASAIFNGHAFVPYGPGQKATEAEKAIEPPDTPAIESPEQSHGRSM
jgi:hypothetical protein